MTDHLPPEGPLARLRAALAGPRGYRRIDELLSAPDAAAAVATLAPNEMYDLVHEVGFADANDLIMLATPSQLRGCLDIDGWDKDHMLPEPMKPWLTAVIEAGFEKVGQVWAGLDAELRALFIQRHVIISDLTLGEEPDETDERPLYFTTDSFFAVRLIGDEDTIRLLRRLLDDLYRADADLARHTLMAARSEPPAELEETSYRWRSGRLADLGYVDFYDALELFRPLDLDKVAIGEGTQDRAPTIDDHATVLPVAVAEEVVRRSFLARALGRISSDLGDAAESERIEAAIVLIVNKVLAAGRARPGQPEVVRRAATYAASTISLGLEAVARGDLERAVLALRSIALIRLFRTGYTITIKLARLAQGLAPRAATAGPPADALVAALSSPRPLFTRSAEQPPEAGVRPFESQADVRRAAELLGQLAARIALVEGLGVNLIAVAQLPEPRPSLDDHVRTALVRAIAGGEFSAAALRQSELAAWRAATGARDLARRTIRGRLDAAGVKLADEQQTILVDGWLADIDRVLGHVIDDAVDARFVDGILVEARRS